MGVLAAVGQIQAANPASAPATTRAAEAGPLDAACPAGFASVKAEGLNGTTGGAGGKKVTVTTAEELLAAIQGDEPRVIYVRGTITLPKGMHHVGCNKSILGLGNNAQLLAGGLELKEVHNVIIRNLTLRGSSVDAITIIDRAHHIWVNHCDLSAAGDGLIDVTHQASYVTVSWNHFSRHHKTCLIGSNDKLRSDIGFLKVTLHHNWFDGTATRHPRVRFGEVHVFNNFYDQVGYGIASTMEAKVVVEGNYFLDVEAPTLCGYFRSGKGELVERENNFKDCGPPETEGAAFDPGKYYPYKLDKAANIPAIVSQGAGVGKL